MRVFMFIYGVLRSIQDGRHYREVTQLKDRIRALEECLAMAEEELRERDE